VSVRIGGGSDAGIELSFDNMLVVGNVEKELTRRFLVLAYHLYASSFTSLLDISHVLIKPIALLLSLAYP
jgi:hypothetical protein